MFENVGWGEVVVILLLALFVFGPDRLPGLAQDLGRNIRKARALLRGLTEDLRTELGPEVGDLDLASLHPKRIVQDLFDERDEPVVPPIRALAPGETPPWDPDTT